MREDRAPAPPVTRNRIGSSVLLGSVSFSDLVLALNLAMGFALLMSNTNPVEVTVIKDLNTEGRKTRLLGQKLYAWSGEPHMWYNAGEVVVSKVASGNGRFTMPADCLKLSQ